MFLKNKNIIFKIRRSKVTDYAALIHAIFCQTNKIGHKDKSNGYAYRRKLEAMEGSLLGCVTSHNPK